MSADLTRALSAGVFAQSEPGSRGRKAPSCGEKRGRLAGKFTRVAVLLAITFALVPVAARAQQSLGAINGTVKDTSGAVVPGATIRAVNVATNLTVNATTQKDGSFNIVDLPIGTYSVTVRKHGFKRVVHKDILVRGNLASTVNVTLEPGAVSTTVTVSATPLLNQTSTTNGYTLGSKVIQSTPLGTGSFTQLATLAPGVNADLLSGSGTNSGLGNQNIWANGQRDTSNSFAFNGVNATNVFNGKSSSSVSSNRLVLNTGESNLSGGAIQTSTSVYNAIGQGLPTPPPETIEELHVTTSMYDASQGQNSGAHVQLITKSGTNNFHGEAYEYHESTGWTANQFFYNASGTPRPDIHRNVFGGLIGGPIIHNKMFFFGSYQGQRVSDNFAGSQEVPVPVGLTNDRSDAGLIAAANSFIDPNGTCGTSGQPACFTGTIDPVARALLNAKLPDGQYLIPSAQITNPNTEQALGYTTVLQGTSRFRADQFNANVDYDFGSKDRLSEKYYFQDNPTSNPFTASPDNASLFGFPMTLKAGSQVFSLDNTTMVSPNLTWEQKFGFIRQIAFGDTSQDFTPSSVGMTLPSNARFPSIYLGSADYTGSGDALSIGPQTNFANAGIFQNQFEGDTNFNWFHGRNDITFGFDWIRNQLNVVNKNSDTPRIDFLNFLGFLQGQVCGGGAYACSGVSTSLYLNGSSNRYFRTNEAGTYIQDELRVLPNFTVDLGMRWDWDGPLVEEHGFLTNFYPSVYSYNVASDTINNIGLVVAGNNAAFGTKGVSASTLTGRQWMFQPRIGLVWSPSAIKNFVVRTGFGMYADRGEFFTELSPSAGGGISGPFGVTTEEPFVVPVLPTSTATFTAPFGTTAPPPPPNNLEGVAALVPNAADLINNTTPYCDATGQSYCGPFLFGGYDPANKLPYSENWTLDLQWQPANSLMLDLAYVGNHGVHEVIPVPFNQAVIATPQNPVLAANPANEQIYSYGYNVPGVAAESISTLVAGFGTGNAALRAPYIGYDPNSEFYMAEGISNYNALQFSVTKRLTSGLAVDASYTWSHALDEGSGMQLFYNGNNPLAPHTGYGNAGFDRTHVFTVSYLYQFPNAVRSHGFLSQALNGWAISGITIAESGQPYSVIDFSGGVGSILYGGGQDEMTNPIVPVTNLAEANAQGTLGVNPANPVLNPNAFSINSLIIQPGTSGVPPCDPTSGACDYYETGFGTTGRNIFRGPFQSRFDMDISKNFKINERFSLKYDAQFFNIFNHPSFDTPNNNVEFNPYFGNPPIYGNFPNTNASYITPCNATTGAYACPPFGRLGEIQHTIGSPRFIEMALHLVF